MAENKKKLVRMDAEQHKVIKSAAKKQGRTFEYLLRQIIFSGISALHLEGK